MAQLLVLLALIGAPPAEGESRKLVVDDAQVQLIADLRLPARVAGVLETLDVKEGDLVKAGQLLGTIDRRLALVQLDVAQLEHDIAKLQSGNDVDKRYAEKSLEVARSELKRSQEANGLYADSVSQTEIERLRLVVDRSRLSLEQAGRDQEVAVVTESLRERGVRLSRLQLDNAQVVAPMDGMVVEVLADRNEWVNNGDTVLRLIQLNRLRVVAHVDGRRFGPELEGKKVNMAVALPPQAKVKEFTGEVVFVSPELQPVTGQVRIWAEVDNPDLELRAGAHGQLTIELPEEAVPAGPEEESR